MQSASDCSLSLSPPPSLSLPANTLSVLLPTDTDTIQCPYYATLTQEVCLNVGNNGCWCTQMWKQFNVTSADYSLIHKIRLFWPHFIIQSGHYKTISTACVVQPISLYYLVHFLTLCWLCSLRAGSGILLANCQQNCMTYTIVVCTVKNSWWWTEELSETCGVLFQK